VRISGIPDADKEKLAKQYEVVANYLTEALGRKFEFVPVSDYAAAVTAMASQKVDLAWFGGVTAVQAIELTKNRCQPLFAREEDLKFKSYFIANKKLVDEGKFKAVDERKPMPLEALAAMKPKFAELTFSFGAKTSTSGHIMPRYFLEKPEVGIDPEKNFKQKPGYALQGGHSTVLSNVGSGAVDLGVLNYLSWEQAKEEQKAQAPVIFVTPEYTDYCMVGHGRLGPALPVRIVQAFLVLDPNNEKHKPVLEVFGTKKFVPVTSTFLAPIAAIVKSAKERGILE
jgi:phosphonate transport system substrate-binding protein